MHGINTDTWAAQADLTKADETKEQQGWQPQPQPLVNEHTTCESHHYAGPGVQGVHQGVPRYVHMHHLLGGEDNNHNRQNEVLPGGEFQWWSKIDALDIY